MKTILMVVLCALITACNTLKVVDDYDPNVQFAKLKTFSLLEGGEIKESGKIQDPLLSKHINKSINKVISAKGFQAVDKDNPDFYISWYGAIDKKIHSETVRNYYNRTYDTNWRSPNYASWRQSSSTYNIEYEKGTLVIDMLDGKTKELIWRGTGSKIIDDRTAGTNVAERVHSVVTEMLKNFPPK